MVTGLNVSMKANANLQWKSSSSGSAAESLCPALSSRANERKVDYLPHQAAYYCWSMNYFITAFLKRIRCHWTRGLVAMSGRQPGQNHFVASVGWY